MVYYADEFLKSVNKHPLFCIGIEWRSSILICFSFVQEDLKILRLMVSVLTEAELEHQEAELTRRMNETREKKTQTAGALAEAKREVDHFRDSYEIVLAEDKALDKAFKKEFADQDVHTVEQLYKLFKRRPR